MSLLSLLSLAALVWVLYEVWGVNKGLSTGSKVIWTIGALFFSVLAAILYYFMEKRKSVA